MEPWETVLTIEGDYSLFAHLETVYLGALTRRTLISTNVRRVVEAAHGKPILFFPARFDHYRVQTGDGYAAHIAGAIGVSTDAQATWWGGKGIGTVPHGLIAACGGDTVLATELFADVFYPEINVTALVDFDNDCVATSLAVARDLGERLWGVRLDTAETLVDRSLWHKMGQFRPNGVAPELVREVRRALDARGLRARQDRGERRASTPSASPPSRRPACRPTPTAWAAACCAAPPTSPPTWCCSTGVRAPRSGAATGQTLASSWWSEARSGRRRVSRAHGRAVAKVIIVVDMLNGFCRIGNLASPRLDSVTGPHPRLPGAEEAAGAPARLPRRHPHARRPRVRDVPASTACEARARTRSCRSWRRWRERGTVIRKSRYSGSYGTELEELLRSLAPEVVEVVGVCTDICVMHTVADLRNRDYAVIVRRDLVATYDAPGHEGDDHRRLRPGAHARHPGRPGRVVRRGSLTVAGPGADVCSPSMRSTKLCERRPMTDAGSMPAALAHSSRASSTRSSEK